MIKNLSLNDCTQENIIEHLKNTEKLLKTVATKLSKEEKDAKIYVMPDLGIAQNATRMLGGFYTGACYTWDTDVPFIPVDATVNVCGTAIYKLNKSISNEEFINRLNNILNDRKSYLDFANKHLPLEVLKTIDINDASKYYWNYTNGNHFIIFAESDGEYGLEKGQYMIVHASAIEFKKDNLEFGLYPVKGNWYYDDIKTEYDEDSKRYLRYITGEKAKRFYDIATYLKDFNKIRNSYFCKAVLGDLLQKEVINISHYGMPTNNSICIGSQWEQLDYALLTAPGNAIYLVHPKLNLNNTFALDNINITLTPHGCGVKMNNSADKIEYLDKNTLKVGNNIFSLGNSVNIGIDVSVRTNGMNEEELDTYILNILKQCPGTVYGKLKQRYAKTKSGDFEFIKEN
ncbi:MAG: hypothetical protein HFI36_03185 [Bacilli bacterium]|jgi:hypothetical protein|nr:hypothetical protein [Bacilli bacterium]MCX4254787.1 hypothetical protein [Bacilli bacterium]